MKKNNQKILIIKILSYATEKTNVHEVTIDDIDDISKKPPRYFRQLTHFSFVGLVQYIKSFLNVQCEADTLGIGKITWHMYDHERNQIWDFEDIFREIIPRNELQQKMALKFMQQIYKMTQNRDVCKVLNIAPESNAKTILSPEKFRFK